MGLLSFLTGGQKNESSQTSTSQGTNFDFKTGLNLSQSTQDSQATSFGSSGSTSRDSIYGGQQPYLDALFARANDLYSNYGMPDKQTADLNPMLATGLAQQYGFSQGVGRDIMTAQLASSLGNLGGYDTAGMTANRMASGNVYRAPTTNGMDYATLNASVNNPFLAGQIDAASQDVVRNLGENVLTGNAAMAAGTGNSGSSRRAVMDAIAQRGAADRIANIASTMRGNAYTQGLGLANQTALANQQARLGTNSLNAGLMGQGANLAYNLGQQGQAGLGQAYQTGLANTQAAQGAGDYIRQYQQQVLDTAFSNQMNPYTGLQMYQSFLGAPIKMSASDSFSNQGSQSTSGSQSTALGYDLGYGFGQNTSNTVMKSKGSSSNGIGGLLQGVGAVATAFCWVAREVYGEDNPRWLAFREWMFTRAPAWFFNLYATHGEAFAEWLKDKPTIKALIRKWMDGRIASLETEYACA